MEGFVPTTPFGRRPVSRGQIAAQAHVQRAIEEAIRPGTNHPVAINKWKLFRTLTEAKSRLGVSDRALSVLNALLSFHPETALALPKPNAGGQGDRDDVSDVDPSCDLVVFPSNKALALRAHGMAPSTLWRHLTALVDAGLLQRRDSPNGKRYARKAGEGAAERFSHAFGFDLTPLVARATEFEAMAEEVRRAARARQLLKERISLLRRDASKLLALGLDEGLPGPWEELRQRTMALMSPLRRIYEDRDLQAISEALTMLRDEIAKLLDSCADVKKSKSNAFQIDMHQSNSKTQRHADLEPASEKEGVTIDADSMEGSGGAILEGNVATAPSYALGLVMEACPDTNEYATGGKIRTWPQFLEAVATIRPMLGISPDAWNEAREALGAVEAHIVVATILQRSEYSSEAAPGGSGMEVNGSPAIRSAGGYLRALTEQARAGTFHLGPVLMALIGQRLKAKRGRGAA